MAKTPPFSVCYEYCVGGGGTNENGIIVVNTEYESADAIPVFTKTGEVAKKLNDVHCGVFKVSFKESEYNGVSTALIFQTTWWGPTNNATENCYQLMYECNGLFRIREEITITVFKTLAWKAIDISNKKTVINNRADDESYPTTLAVKKFVDAHTSNGDIHVTLEDKQKWNDKYTKEEVNSKFALNENGIIDVEYESDAWQITFGELIKKIEYYDANGHSVDLSDPQVREKLHTGIYRIKVKSNSKVNWDYDFDTDVETYDISNSYSEVILIQTVNGYDTVENEITHIANGMTEVRQVVLSELNNSLKNRVARIKKDGSLLVTPVWEDKFAEFEVKGWKVSDINDPYIGGSDEYAYPNVKAVTDYVKNFGGNPIINTAEGSVINITDSANAELKGLKIFGKTTQEGEPSIENPQPLVNVGDGGGVVTKVYGKNLFNISSYDALNKQADDSYSNKVKTNTATRYPLSLPYGSYTISYDLKCPTGKNARIQIILKDGTTIEDYKVSTGEFIHFKKSFNGAPESWRFNYGASCETDTLFIKNMQLEVGSVVTEYEPYKEHQSFTLNTPNGLAGVPVASGGNYTDENGQQWICDEIDLARGKYVQRIGKIEEYSNEEIALPYISTTGELSVGATVMYVLEEPIETDLELTEDEIAQYKALTTNKPVTNVFNDADAHMKLDYVADTKNYIDNKFANIENAILSLGGNV